MTERPLYLIGGQQRSPRPLLENQADWFEYKKGLVLRLNPATGDIHSHVEYISRPGTRSPGDPILFKSGTVKEDRLYVCTQTEVVVYSLPEFEIVNHISLPCFNDLHHVYPTPAGTLLIANSGLEMVLEITPNGHVCREWNVLNEEPWEKFSRKRDYRLGVNLKPHRAHPNHIFFVGDDIWVTRFELRDAISLTGKPCRLHVGQERIHDGVVMNGHIYFTTVDGNLVIADPNREKIVEVVELRSMHPRDTLLGWCRGLYLEEDRAWVGFSRIRPTRFRAAVSWVRKGFDLELPTRVACYDLSNRRCLMEFDLEPFGLNAIYSIQPAPHPVGSLESATAESSRPEQVR